MKCNQICKWNSNAGCVKPYGVPCILGNVSITDRKTTNADRIRAMSDDELTDFLNHWADFKAWKRDPGATKDWLQQPAEGE